MKESGRRISLFAFCQCFENWATEHCKRQNSSVNHKVLQTSTRKFWHRLSPFRIMTMEKSGARNAIHRLKKDLDA